MHSVNDPLEARLAALERQLLAQQTETAYYRRLAKYAGDGRLREVEAYSSLVSQLKEQLAIIAAQHAELAQLNLEIERIAITDELTQILNRRGIIAHFQRIFADCRRDAGDREAPGACFCALLDIDFFKNINDTHGHGAGDEVLRQLGAILAGAVRLNASDGVGRYGGEEFLFVLPGRHKAEALATLNRIVDQIRAHRFAISEHGGIWLTVSIGVSAVAPEDSSVFTVIDRADAALYQAKQRGRNRIVGLERRRGQDRRREDARLPALRGPNIATHFATPVATEDSSPEAPEQSPSPADPQ